MNSKFRLKGIVMEDFIQYGKPSLFLSTCFCDWKCCHDGGFDESVCQNEPLAQSPIKEVDISVIYNAYINNDITKAIVFGGLEPMKQFEEIVEFIQYFRGRGCNDDIVIYTGYYKNELEKEIQLLQQYNNIIIKFGRFVPNDTPRYDDVLGITLISSNQYAERIS